MRKALRAAVLLLTVYLLQSTVLVYARIGGVIPDVLTVTLYACGYSFGLYGGLCMGLAGALLMEIVGGELAGMTTVWCVGASCFGVYVAWQAAKPRPAGASWMRKLLWLLVPALGAGAIAAGKEALQLIYFYLTGVDIVFIHLFRVFFSGLEVTVMALILLPAFRRFLLCPADQTFLAKRIAKHRARKAEKAEIEQAKKQKTNQDVQDLRRRLTYFVTLDDTAFDQSEFPEEEKASENGEKTESRGEEETAEAVEEEETDKTESQVPAREEKEKGGESERTEEQFAAESPAPDEEEK